MADCKRCGEFAGDEAWRKYCRSCYAAMKREEELERQDLIYRQATEIRELKAQLAASDTAIDDRRLKQLIQLCHPDKHHGSPTSNEVTQWLLKMRRSK